MAVLTGIRYFGAFFFSARYLTPVYFGTPPSVPTFVPRQVRKFSSGVVCDINRVAPQVLDLATPARVYGGPSQQASWARVENFWFDGMTPYCRRPPIADSIVFSGKEPPVAIGPTGKPVVSS